MLCIGNVKNMENKNKGKKKLSSSELKARQEFLSKETIEQRTKRVFNPRIKKILKQLDSLVSCVNSPRYKLSQEQAEIIYGEIEKRTIALNTVFTKANKEEIKDLL